MSKLLSSIILSLLFVIIGIITCNPAYSQYTDETFALKKISEQFDERGFQNGQAVNIDGKLAVSNANGAVHYSYPLDQFTQKGYNFQVNLNYCNSVSFSSFKARYAVGDFWDRFTRTHPLWIIGVNGFAVQTLSLVSDYMPPSNLSKPMWDGSEMPWLIEGYDFCNRMNRMESTGKTDVIRLLRADGSLLELRNPYKFGTEGGTVAHHQFVTGYYFEDEVNAGGWAYVSFDTVRMMSDMYDLVQEYINGPLGQGNPDYWKNQLYRELPRRVSYYPGDGLEYVFVEHQVTYGWPRYDGDDVTNGGKTAGPTIFYLKEINDASGVVMELKYSRHETPGDGTPGRALVKEIGDYVKFNYGDQFISIQAHGRTTSLQLQKAIPFTLFDEQDGGNFNSKVSYISMVKALRDPENRLTEFAYENYERIFRDYKHPYNDVDKLKITSSRLNSIKEPATQYSIVYHEGTVGEREIVYVPNPTPTGALADWRLNNAAKSVTKYNNKHQWLTTETYCFDGLSTSDPQMCNNQVQGFPRTVYRLKDRQTQKEKQITYTYQQMEVQRYRGESAPSLLALPLVYTALRGIEEEADGKVMLTETDYAVQSNSALILPTEIEHYVRESNSPSAIRTTLRRRNYITSSGHGYGGPSLVAAKHTLKVNKQIDILYNPENGTDILLQNVTEYLHLPYVATTQQVAQVWWDKLSSYARYDSLYNAGVLSCYWEDMPDSLHVFDTLGVRKFSQPPFHSLITERYQLNAQNRYLGGIKTAYEETSVAPGSNRRGLPLRDSLIAEDRISATLLGENTYGWHASNNGGYGWSYTDERLPTKRRDGNGAIIEQAYRFASRGIPSGLRLNDDGTTENTELRDRLLGLGLEKPLIDKKLIRNPRTGMTDTLQSRNEWTFYGLLSGNSDYNGYYSHFKYDKNGRLSIAQLPKDFLGAQTTCTERVDGLVEYKAPLTWTDSDLNRRLITCPNENIVSTWAESDRSYLALTAGITYYDGPCPPLYQISTGLAAPTTGETAQRQGKRGREEVLATSGTITFETYTKQQTDVAVCHFDVIGADNLFDVAQTLRSGSFRCFISSMQGRCFTMEVIVRRVSDGEKMATRRYVMNCQIGGALMKMPSAGEGKRDAILSGGSDGDYLFTIPFNVSELQTFSQSGSDGFDVEIHVKTPGARVNLVADAEDKRPHWQLDGVFNLPVEQKQFTISYQYSTKTDDAVVQRVKTDDRYTSVNYPNSECRPMRYREVRHEFGADRLVEKTKISIGDPTLPIRIDSVLTNHTGFGQVRKTTDQEGFVVHTEFDALGRPVKVINADSTYTTFTYEFGDPMNIPWQPQDYYGYYEAAISTTYDKDNLQQHVSYKYTDALGRLRHEQAGGGGFGITKYQYDYRNRLVTVINPSGDETQYWYDEYSRVKYKYQPDMGYTSYAYDVMGNVRFTQTEKQSDSGQLTFMQYDDLGRATLVGEARLDGEPGGGGHGGIGITGGGGKKEQTLSVPPPAPRLTDGLDGKILHDGGQSNAVTANKTVWLGALSPLPQFWTMNQLSQTECIPQPIIGSIVPPFMAHPVQNYNDPGLPLATENDFEDIARYPENARTAIYYDDLPATAGSVWLNFPIRSQWNALAPTGVVRNLKGKQSAVAYRGHAGEPYHFVVMSYDERGRVEALLRYTENLGFDAVYYRYNAMNAITNIRAVDPLRQSSAWYSYDWNGRVDSVWTTLSIANNGLGIVNPSYRSPETRPAQPDIVYSYSKRGTVDKMKYPQVATEVNYRYNARAFLDTLLAEKNGVLTFRQLLEYNSLSRITKQRSQHTGQSEVTAEYMYDYLGQLANVTETRNGIMTVNTYDYDEVGNRMFNIALGPQPGRNSYEYNDANGPNRLSTRRDSVYQNGVWTEAGYTSYSYNVNGALTNRTQTGIGNPITETFDYDNIQNVVKKYTRAQGASVDDWRYRYSSSAEREQKRLYSTTQQPVREWAYYLLGGDKKQLAVYTGIETNQTSCGQVFGATPVYLSASEYLFYGGSTHNLTIKPTGLSTSRKEYKVQDMLGSTRVVIEPDGMGGGAITGQYDYAPFGGIIWQSAPTQRLSYIDKEKDKESSLGDFGVRKYDDVIGRFMSVDIMWESYRNLSPYHYCRNNPLLLIDPSGMVDEEKKAEKKDEENNTDIIPPPAIPIEINFDITIGLQVGFELLGFDLYLNAGSVSLITDDQSSGASVGAGLGGEIETVIKPEEPVMSEGLNPQVIGRQQTKETSLSVGYEQEGVGGKMVHKKIETKTQDYRTGKVSETTQRATKIDAGGEVKAACIVGVKASIEVNPFTIFPILFINALYEPGNNNHQGTITVKNPQPIITAGAKK